MRDRNAKQLGTSARAERGVISKLVLVVMVSLFAAFVVSPAAAAAEAGCQKTVSLEEFRERVKKAGLYAGGPTEYTDVGRRTLAKAIDVGLTPDGKVLDIGAGSLRIGWWLLQYIDASNYWVIEPARERVDAAAKALGVDIHLFYNYDFEFPSTGFDLVLARSIWTHASKAMISKMLSEFAEKAEPDGKFLASIYFANNPEGDYKGEEWIGMDRVHNGMRIVFHLRDWVEAEAAKHGLKMTVAEELHGQTWVVLERAS